MSPHRQCSLAQCKYKKLATCFYGPFRIIEHIGKVSYKLELPYSTTIHHVFHVSQLRYDCGITNSSPILPLQLKFELEMLVEPKLLLRVRHKFWGQLGDVEVLLKWKALPVFEATWKDFYVTQKQFLEFHLEGECLDGVIVGHMFISPIIGEWVKWKKHKHVDEYKLY